MNLRGLIRISVGLEPRERILGDILRAVGEGRGAVE